MDNPDGNQSLTARLWGVVKYVMTPRVWRLIFSLVAIAGIIAFLGVVSLVWYDKGPADAPMGEVVSPEEQYLTSQIISAAISTSISSRAVTMAKGTQEATSAETAPGFEKSTYRRDVHAKAHGCVAAKFTVDSLPDRYAVGIFAKPLAYDAVLRFSSGNPLLQPDSAKDVQGLALKVFGVDGPKLLDAEGPPGRTQDFVMMNNPVFFIRGLADYREFNKLLAAKGAAGGKEYFIGFRNPLTWHVRELILGTMAQRSPPNSVVATRYWSGSAYALGTNLYVKYSLRPDPANKPKLVKLTDQNRFDSLRVELTEQAKAGGARFDFLIQPQVLGKYMPVEDTTEEWLESDSPFLKVGTVELVPLASANTDSINRNCESLSFNPWRALKENRPVGAMNRVRKALYDAMSRFRRMKNCGDGCVGEPAALVDFTGAK